ncbi:MAG TPA: 3',5'-cyclic-AMP phosphodiesterase [Thiotrichaceae bacterium]|jgi:Icc protein|nr:3',5'-cyclic-AMP phosphodiesterase [Thiotrichaceae bacterium]
MFDSKEKNEKGTVVLIKPGGSIKIIQITDTHIIDDDAPLFSGFDTSVSLLQVIDNIRENESDADLILLTGDLIHEATKTSYHKLSEHLSTLSIPVFCLPGNHDDPEILNEIMTMNGYGLGKVIKAGQWLIILLDTCVKGEHRGELSNSELEFLETTLASHANTHCLIALHHHPVPINSPWMDAMSLTNTKELLSIIDKFDHVRALVWGHIHQEFELLRNNVRLLGTPSTCLQFKPESDVYAVDDKPPAYRKLELLEDGNIKTEVVYVLE